MLKNYNSIFFILIAILSFSFPATAQTIITGTAVDAVSKQPLSAVSIVIDNSKNEKAITDDYAE